MTGHQAARGCQSAAEAAEHSGCEEVETWLWSFRGALFEVRDIFIQSTFLQCDGSTKASTCQSYGSCQCPGCPTLHRAAGPERPRAPNAHQGGVVPCPVASAAAAAAAARPRVSLGTVETKQSPRQPPAAVPRHVPGRGSSYRRNAVAFGELMVWNLPADGALLTGLHLHQESSPARAQSRGQSMALCLKGSMMPRSLPSWTPWQSAVREDIRPCCPSQSPRHSWRPRQSRQRSHRWPARSTSGPYTISCRSSSSSTSCCPSAPPGSISPPQFCG